MKCKQCGENVPQTQGKQAKVFCGDRCRMAFKRATPNKKETATPNKPTPNTEQVATPNKLTYKREKWSGETVQHDPRLKPSDTDGHCKGCGEKQPNPLCDICHKCIAKGCTRESLGLPTTDHQRWLNDCQA